MAMMTTTVAPRSWASIVKGKSDSETAALHGRVASSKLPEKSTFVPDASTDVDIFSAQPCHPESSLDVPKSESQHKTVAESAVDVPASAHQSATTQPNAGQATLKPGSRGGFQCFCRGQVLSMLTHYGWLWASGDIDHPLTSKHFGRIYVHRSDVADGHALNAGDMVSFYLYVDNVGLGAEACRVQPKETDLAPAAKLRADAAEFVPGGGASVNAGTDGPVADMFVRMSRTFKSIPANGYVQMAGVMNSAYFDDDESSEDGEDGNADADAESFHDESDSSSFEGFHFMQKGNGLDSFSPWKQVSCPASNPEKVKWKASPDGSTSPGVMSDSTNAGNTSESESEGKFPLCVLPGLVFPTFRLPPGLEDVVPIPP